MKSNRRSEKLGLVRIIRTVPVMAAIGFIAFPLNVSAQTQRIVQEIEGDLGIPEIQAIVSACLQELVYFTGTVRTVVLPNGEEHINWGQMIGETIDGDLFIGGSGVGGNQSNLTIAEVGGDRQVHLTIVDGILTAVCHI